MRANWRAIALIALFVLQTVMVVASDRHFHEAMDFRRDLVQSSAIEAGLPEKQALAIASVVRGAKYEVSSYVRNVLALSLMFNFSMLMVVLSSRQKGAA